MRFADASRHAYWRRGTTPSKRIVVLVGLPGSGKSTWIRERGLGAISSDEIRFLLADDRTDQTLHRQVFAAMRYLLKQRLELGRTESYLDATHLTPRERRPYIAIGDLYDCRVEARFFDVSFELCKERNRGRERVVPEEAMDQMNARLVPPSLAEGFASIERVTQSATTSEPPST